MYFVEILLQSYSWCLYIYTGIGDNKYFQKLSGASQSSWVPGMSAEAAA